MAKTKTERESILDKVKKLLGLRGKAEDWAELLPPEGTTRFPGQEGLEGLGIRDIEAGSYKQHQFADDMFRYERPFDGFRDPKFDEERFNSTLMRNAPDRRPSPSILDIIMEYSREGRPDGALEGLTDPNFLNRTFKYGA